MHKILSFGGISIFCSILRFWAPKTQKVQNPDFRKNVLARNLCFDKGSIWDFAAHRHFAEFGALEPFAPKCSILPPFTKFRIFCSKNGKCDFCDSRPKVPPENVYFIKHLAHFPEPAHFLSFLHPTTKNIFMSKSGFLKNTFPFFATRFSQKRTLRKCWFSPRKTLIRAPLFGTFWILSEKCDFRRMRDLCGFGLPKR